jgi:hypothetical protein
MIKTKNGKYCIVVNDKIIVDYIYDYIQLSNNTNYYSFKKDDNMGLFDKNGKIFISGNYNWINFYSQNKNYILYRIDDCSYLVHINYLNLIFNLTEMLGDTFIYNIEVNNIITQYEQKIRILKLEKINE